MSFSNWFFGPRVSGYGDHIQTLAEMCGEKDDLNRQLAVTSENIVACLDRDLAYQRGIIKGLLGALKTSSGGYSHKPETEFFRLIFSLDDRISIKRALQLLEDAVE